MGMVKHFLVRGRVQGVGYRYFTLEAAHRWKVYGYARNLPTGEVEVYAEADESSLMQFRRDLERGPLGARVSEVIEEDLPGSATHTSFVIRG